MDGFKARIRLYDYGVVSIALTRPFCGSWGDLVGLGQTLIESDELEQRAEAMCRTIVERTRPALIGLRATFVAEDYLVYVVHELDAHRHRRTTARRARRPDRGDAARRAAEIERSGEDDDSPSPDLIPGRRSRHPDVERRVRLRHTDRRASGARDRRVRQFTAARVPLLRRAARRRAGVDLRAAAAARLVRSNGAGRATRAPPARCTRCSSRSTRSPIGPRTR